MLQTIDQAIIDLYDEYTHTSLPRRVFLDRLTRLAGGTAAALALLPLLENGAAAAIVPPEDPRLDIARLSFPGASGPINAYRARPRGAGRLPAVVVIHENRGLNPHIEDVARRLALEGFLAVAPDALTPAGGTPPDQDKARDMIGKLDRAQTIANYSAAVTWLKAGADGNGKVGVVGFCWGGGMVNQVAVNLPGLDAGVAYYGAVPRASDVPKIKAPLLLHYAGLDKRINAGKAGYEAALKSAGKDYAMHLYEGANHAFNNDTNAARYNRAAAELAWGRTVAFLRRHLSA
jgi:carboxymethylenebutenolidase